MKVEHCYFHDGTGGNLFKSHAPRNVIRYNWFENAYHSAINIVDPYDSPTSPRKVPDSPLYPMYTDIVGNVFISGWSPMGGFCHLRIGGEHRWAAGTEGDFNIAHNLFIVTRIPAPDEPDDEGTLMRVHGNVDNIKLYNNVFLERGTTAGVIYSRGKTWGTPRTRAFQKKRGHGEPIVEGANNWVSIRTIGIPESFIGTLVGRNPLFEDLLNFRFRPQKDSPLVDAGLWPLPMGKVVDLVPEYEPQRGIPADLKPTPRRKVTPPSIGPFEMAQ